MLVYNFVCISASLHVYCRCDQNGDGKLDYSEFRRYLTAHSSESLAQSEGMVSTSGDTYSARPHVRRHMI